MTAQLVNGITRAPLQRIFYAYPRSGDLMSVPNVPGQLWERVAEMGDAGVVNSPNYTARIANATRKVWLDGRYRRMGDLAIDAPAAGAREASGIIIAGVLHGSRVSAPYTHTGFEAGAL